MLERLLIAPPEVRTHAQVAQGLKDTRRHLRSNQISLSHSPLFPGCLPITDCGVKARTGRILHPSCGLVA
jgi:hypothetical protein